MGLAVVSVASGGLPVVESTAGGTPVTEATNGRGVPVTKVIGKPGLPVVFETIGMSGGSQTINSPLDLTGLVGWWDASVTASLNLTGSTVNSIADQISARTMVQGTAFAKPTYSATGFNTTKPGILIDTAVGSAMETASGFPMGTGNTLTWFCVATRAGATSNSAPRHLSYRGAGQPDDHNNIGSWCWACGSGQTPISFSRNAPTYPPVSIALAAGNHVFIGTVNSSGVVTNYINGVATVCQTAPGNWVDAGIFAIGHKAGVAAGGEFITGTFAEWGVATGLHNATQIGQLYTYLKNKWGL